jgi:hypothetical protein
MVSILRKKRLVKSGKKYFGKSFTVEDHKLLTQVQMENVDITFQIVNQWEENCNAIIRIENISDSTIENWSLSCVTGDSISNVYDATLC